jgi:toxin ParE1/3/4
VTLEFSEKSLEDLEGILQFIARDKPIAATRFVGLIEQQCLSLCLCPAAGTAREDLAPGLRLFSFRGYGIYFRALPNAVRIERVLHGAMDITSEKF